MTFSQISLAQTLKPSDGLNHNIGAYKPVFDYRTTRKAY